MGRQLCGILSLAGACLLTFGCLSGNGGNSQTGTGGAAQAGGVTGISGSGGAESGGSSGGTGGAMTGGRSGSGGATSSRTLGSGGVSASGGSTPSGASGGVSASGGSTPSGGSGGSASDPVTPTRAANKYKLSFGDVVMEIDAAVGARVTTLTLGGTNLIMPLATDLTACSSTFWTSPRSDWTPGTNDWPPPVAIDSGPYDGTISGTHALFKGSKDPTLGVSMDKDFSADAGTGWISITYTINTTDAIKAAPWEVTRVPRGGIAFFPSGEQAMTNGAWKTVTQGNGITWVDDTAMTPTSPNGGKAYGDGTGGWFAYAVGGNLFLKRFTDTPANQQAPNDGEVSVYSGTGFLEFEVQGPYGPIAAGGKQTWSVQWHVVKIPSSVTVAVGNASLSDFAAAQAAM